MNAAKILFRFVITASFFALLTIGLEPPPVVSKIRLMNDGHLCSICPWPKFQYNNRNTGFGSFAGPGVSNLKFVGRYRYAAGGGCTAVNDNWIYGHPAVGADGTIYYGTFGDQTTRSHKKEAKLYALEDCAGQPGCEDNVLRLKWAYPKLDIRHDDPEGELCSIEFTSPAITGDGVLYVGTDCGLHALQDMGDHAEKFWFFDASAYGHPVPPAGEEAQVNTSPAIGADGTIYFAACFLSLTLDENLYYGQFFALNPDGTMKWNAPFETDSWITASPAIGADGTVYFASTGDGQLTNPEGPKLYALRDMGDRYELKWAFAAEARISFAPAIDDRGVIYFGTSAKNYAAQPGKLYALDDCYGEPDCPNGWKHHWQEPQTYTFINNDGLVDENEKGWCLAASVSIGPDGTLYAPILKAGNPADTAERSLRVVDPTDGKILGITEQAGGPALSFRYDLGEPVMMASPSIDANGNVYLCSWRTGSPGHFWAFSPDLKNFSRLETEQVVASSPAIGASGHIYFGTSYPEFENNDYDPIFYAVGSQ